LDTGPKLRGRPQLSGKELYSVLDTRANILQTRLNSIYTRLKKLFWQKSKKVLMAPESLFILWIISVRDKIIIFIVEGIPFMKKVVALMVIMAGFSTTAFAASLSVAGFWDAPSQKLSLSQSQRNRI
jgi:hypothetical protein